MATNDSGYPISVGPDVDGKYFLVQPGHDYTPPVPLEPAEASEPISADPADSPLDTTAPETPAPSPAPPTTPTEPAKPQPSGTDEKAN